MANNQVKEVNHGPNPASVDTIPTFVRQSKRILARKDPPAKKVAQKPQGNMTNVMPQTSKPPAAGSLPTAVTAANNTPRAAPNGASDVLPNQEGLLPAAKVSFILVPSPYVRFSSPYIRFFFSPLIR
jgi:hypothetical protein